MKIMKTGAFVQVKGGASFPILLGAPTEWAQKWGATHSLLSENGGVRGCILTKTRLRVMVDENPGGGAVWETWELKPYEENIDEDWAKGIICSFHGYWKSNPGPFTRDLGNWEPLPTKEGN